MSNQQYRHCGRKLTPAELVEFLTDQHCAMVDDPIMLWLSPQSLEDFADLIAKAIRDSESVRPEQEAFMDANRFRARAFADASKFGDGQDAFDDWRQS